MKFIDVSHEVEHGMVTYPGLPPPSISDFLSRDASRLHYGEGTTFHIGKIDMVANTATYLDAPFHRYQKGKDLSELDLAVLANLPGLVFRPNSGSHAIGPALFEGKDLGAKAILIHTGWDRHWKTDRYFEGHPFLTEETARYLTAAKAALVGIDSLNIDDNQNPTRPVHSILLEADIPIVEHLCNLEALPDDGFKFFAVPVKIKKFGSFPVRAFALVE
jgi:kynurenine formamidase